MLFSFETQKNKQRTQNFIFLQNDKTCVIRIEWHGVKAFTKLYLITEKILSAKIILHILRLAFKKLKVQRRISNTEYVCMF